MHRICSNKKYNRFIASENYFQNIRFFIKYFKAYICIVSTWILPFSNLAMIYVVVQNIHSLCVTLYCLVQIATTRKYGDGKLFLQFGTSEYQFNFMYPVSHNLLTTRYSTYFPKVCRLLKNWFPCGVNGGRQVDVPKFPQCILQICYCFYPICMSTWRLYWRSSKWNMFKT